MPISPLPEDIGRKVIYRPYVGAPVEIGVITSFTPAFVFVRYGSDAHAKATNSADLEWEDARNR